MVTFDIIDSSIDESYVTSEPVTVDDALLQAYANDYDTSKITELITQARQAIENYCNISIVTKAVAITALLKNKPVTKYASYASIKDTFVESELPYGPIGSIISIFGAFNIGDTLQLLTENVDYFLYGGQFQTIRIYNKFDQVLLNYYTGYSVCPEQLKLAILSQLAFLFENRGDTVNRYAQQNVGISEVAQQLATPYIRQAWL